MMLPRRFERIVLLAPDGASGGPEAVHQLRQILSDMGLDAKILLYRNPADLSFASGEITRPFARPIRDYDRYKPLFTESFALKRDSLVILPEARAALFEQLAPATVAIWWLSTANAFPPGSRLLEDAAYRKRFFADRSIIHLCQTAHSRQLLRDSNGPEGFDLVDYTDERFTLTKPAGPNAGDAIAFNPIKRPQVSTAFFQAFPEFTPLPISGMQKPQVLEALRGVRTYVEFGLNPGKDRLPREAAAAGCIVLTWRDGGSRLFDDMPLGARYKFPLEDVTNGRLAQLLREIAADPQPHWDDQAYYRNYVFTEKALMQVQARRIFDI